MTTTTSTPDLAPTGNHEPPSGGGVSFPRTLHAEWIKFSSLRSSWAVLAAAVAGLILIALAIAYNTGRTRVGLVQ